MLDPSVSFDSNRKYNRCLNIKEFENEKIVLKSRPRILFVELTQNCNLGCWMCRNKRPWDKNLDMNFCTFKRIADELFPYAEIIDLRGWGESTVLPWFSDALEYAAQYGAKLKIYTNLTVQNPDILRNLIKNDVFTAISFDGATKRTFELIRRGSNFENVIKNIQLLINYSRELKKQTKRIYFSVTVQGLNLKEIPLIIQTASNFHIETIKLFPIICDLKYKDNLKYHIPLITETLDKVEEYSRKFNISVELGATLNEALAVKEALLSKCVHPWMYCYINSWGGVGFCDHLIGKQRYILGNIRKKSFMKIWNNSEFQFLRRQHCGAPDDLSNRFDVCRWCYNNRYIDFEHFLYPELGIKRVNSKKSPLYEIQKSFISSERRFLES